MAKGNVGKRSVNALRSDERLLGTKIGRLTVLRYVDAVFTSPKTKLSRYECVCDCGNIKLVVGNHLQQGIVRSCGCWFDENRQALGAAKTSLRYPVGEVAFRGLFRRYQGNAKKRGLTFNLSAEDAHRLFSGNCYYCGAHPGYTYPAAGDLVQKPNGKIIYNGIDRLINCLGYEPLNCVSCCWPCNHRKGTMDAHVFLAWVTRILEYRRTQDGNEDKTVYSAISARSAH